MPSAFWAQRRRQDHFDPAFARAGRAVHRAHARARPRPPSGRVAALARVGPIIEEPRFHPHLTGRENLDVHAAARDRSAHARIDAALEGVGLAARGDDRVKAYSLGMRQRLGIARCLLADPELLILAEPMNGLDPAGILEFRRLIRELVGEGRTVLLSSHLLDEVEKTCDLAAIVDQGRIVAQGSIGELVRGGPRAIDIVCYRLGAPRGARGHEQQSPRYAVVVQSDQLPLSTWLGAPTSTSARPASFRPEVEILQRTTRVLAEQTAAVDPTRLGDSAGQLTFHELRQVEAALRLVLDV